MQLEGYSKLRRIYSSHKSVVYTGIDEKRRQAVWLKRPLKTFPTARQISGLSREFEILRHLDILGIPKAWVFPGLWGRSTVSPFATEISALIISCGTTGKKM